MVRMNRILGVVVLLGFLGALFAQPDMPEPPDVEPLPPMMYGSEKRLDLTDEQASKIAEMKLQLKKELLPLQSEMLQHRNTMKGLLTNDQPNKSEINKTIDVMSDIRKQMHQLRIDHVLKVRNLLTDEQKKKFDMMILSGKHRGFHGHDWKDRHHKRPMHGPKRMMK